MISAYDLARRRAQNLSAPRSDARAVTPSIRNFAQAIDRQRDGIERIPLLAAGRADLLPVAAALDAAEAAALAFSLREPAELPRFAEAARAASVPVLRTDLILEEFQIYETRAAGADALLLHASALPGELLVRLCAAVASTHMTACVACASADEVARALAARAPVLALDDVALAAKAPRRTLVLSLGGDARLLRGRADAVLDPSFAAEPDPARAFAAMLAKES